MNVVSRRHPVIGDYVCKEKRALSDRSQTHCAGVFRKSYAFSGWQGDEIFCSFTDPSVCYYSIGCIGGQNRAGDSKQEFFCRTGLFDNLYKSRTFMCGFVVLKCNGLKKSGMQEFCIPPYVTMTSWKIFRAIVLDQVSADKKRKGVFLRLYP